MTHLNKGQWQWHDYWHDNQKHSSIQVSDNDMIIDMIIKDTLQYRSVTMTLLLTWNPPWHSSIKVSDNDMTIDMKSMTLFNKGQWQWHGYWHEIHDTLQ